MKLLLDECMPRGLMATFPENCEVKTVRGIGWSGTKNGVLLQRAADAGFDALITVDSNIEHQQNLDRLPITIVVLKAQSSKHKDLRPLIPRVVSILKNNRGKNLVNVRMSAIQQDKTNDQTPELF